MQSSQVDNLKKTSRIFMVFGLVFVAFGMIFVYFFLLRPILAARAAADWPTTRGTVLASEVESSRSSEGGTTYRPSILYEYEVDGHLFEADQYDPRGSISTSDRIGARAIVSEHPVGKKVDVYYNPNNPGKAMPSRELELGFQWFVLIFPAGGLFFAFLGWFIGRRARPDATADSEPLPGTPWHEGSS
jgi:hypothetical protein